MTDATKIEITSIEQFFQEARKQGYMTVTKDYGLLAIGHGRQLKGELVTISPTGDLDPSEYVGWMEINTEIQI